MYFARNVLCCPDYVVGETMDFLFDHYMNGSPGCNKHEDVA